MEIFENITEFKIEERTAVAIGKFDGFHRGHQKLLDVIKEQKQKGFASVVFTFVPSPATFFCKENIKELTTIEEKRRIFENAGVDYLVEYPFNQKIADMEPEDFITNVLVDRLNAGCVVAGEDVSFGKKGVGDAALLNRLSCLYDYKVIIIDKVQYEGREVSSSYVRDEVRKGNMETAEKLLGTPYHVGGTVVHGRQLGRTLGMPTLNLLPPAEKLLPPNGVYYSYVILNGKKYNGITNIGTKPTVNDEPVIGVETYLYDFNGNVYGEDIEVYLLKYKRSEMRFGNVDELKNQMNLDINSGREYHNNYNYYISPEQGL